jgi:hypothetical protein
MTWAACACQFDIGSNSIQGWWEDMEKLQPTRRQEGFNSLFMLTGWHIWKER